MELDGEQESTATCGAVGEDGRRLASLMLRDGREFVERLRVEEAFERVCFVARALRHFGIELSAERLAELELQLVRAVREADNGRACDDESPLVRLSDIQSEPVHWLWPGRIARGEITLLAGDPGLGKSLVTLDVAARVSRGMSWPDGASGLRQGASVLLLNGEDDLQVTIRGRLEALGADCYRIATICRQQNRVSGKEPLPFALDRDFDELVRTVEQLGDCALVVLDPVSAFLGRRGECSNADVRRLLLPLSELARRKRLAVLMVSHLRKDLGVAVRQALGSIAFVAVSRAAWLVSRDADQHERRLMLPVKNNLAADVGGLAFTVEPRGAALHSDEGHAHREHVVVKWSADRIKSRVDEILSESRRPAGRPDTERREAMEWLREYLSKGPQGATEVREAGEAQGFTFSTLRRAFRALGGVAVKGRDGWRDGWQWKLPGRDTGEEVEERSGGVAEESSGGVVERATDAVAEMEAELAALREKSGDIDQEIARRLEEASSGVDEAQVDAATRVEAKSVARREKVGDVDQELASRLAEADAMPELADLGWRISGIE